MGQLGDQWRDTIKPQIPVLKKKKYMMMVKSSGRDSKTSAGVKQDLAVYCFMITICSVFAHLSKVENSGGFCKLQRNLLGLWTAPEDWQENRSSL